MKTQRSTHISSIDIEKAVKYNLKYEQLQLREWWNGQKRLETPQLFSICTPEYENESNSYKAGHKNERELTNTKNFEMIQFERNYVKYGWYTKIQYRVPTDQVHDQVYSNYQVHDQVQLHIVINKFMTLGLNSYSLRICYF